MLSRIQIYKDRLEALKAQPKKSLGQNFLVSELAITKITDWARFQKIENVFEIGPGLGALTEILREDYQKLKLIELDTQFSEFWRTENIEVIEHDALKLNWKEQLTAEKNLLVSNLPYQISAGLVIELSQLEKSFDSMVLMFQKEVAERICAEDSTKEYGLLSVIAQTFWDVSKLLDLSPGDFYPAPKVASRVLCFKSLYFKGLEPISFTRFVKHCFSQRRKVLLKRLKDYKTGSELEQIFEYLNIKKTARPENITPETYVELFLKVTGD